ncbi:HET-domain-containing protein [Decorospora gaudefroyi]|uniref:HET-domain-containing protein n=1 Tax=Decorospora gaudefroyi TaxID=184978 RepID=A0A6A5KGS1_9PLEO|nr:HET-domain-containing protein [Decorospora gaudefroyi]
MAADTVPLGPYTYEPLDPGSVIRLLRLRKEGDQIRYDLCTCSLLDPPQYAALSYTWGAPTPTFAHTLNGNKRITVRENLHKFLEHYREEGYLWIDQICIDQSNVSERNHQVSLMKEIYCKASFVNVWLQNEYRNPKFMLNPSSGEQAVGEEIVKIFRDKYWTRLWITQEFLLAERLQIMFQGDAIPWEELCTEVRAYNDISSRVAFFVFSSRSPAPFTLKTCIGLFSGAGCQDPRDKVYGLMGVVVEDERLSIDYSKSKHEVFADVVAAFWSAYAKEIAQSTGKLSKSRFAALRANYTQTLHMLREEMDFYKNEGEALQGLIDEIWSLYNLGESFQEREESSSLLTAVGYEPGQQQDLDSDARSQDVATSSARWWYESTGQRRYFECS